jgi:hypothetical protein
MRSYQVFAAMSPDRAEAVLGELAEHVPQMFMQALVAASASMHARPVYLRRQPFEKQAQAVRRALSRVAANPIAEEILAAYFLECRKELLAGWLDALGIEHDEGTLKEDAPATPNPTTLKKAHSEFCSVDDDPDRQLLLRAFAAQSAIDWPDLEAMFETEG